MKHNSAVDKQERILKFIKDFNRTPPYYPTVEEIRAGCNLSTTSLVFYHLKKLQAAGKVEVIPSIARGIRLL